MPLAVGLALAILLALLVVVVLRHAGPGRSAVLLQQQLLDLRSRFDQLIAAQQEMPRTLAQGSADQARLLLDVRERLGQLGETAKRLEGVGETVSRVPAAAPGSQAARDPGGSLARRAAASDPAFHGVRDAAPLRIG
jgi:hypothetical protein